MSLHQNDQIVVSWRCNFCNWAIANKTMRPSEAAAAIASHSSEHVCSVEECEDQAVAKMLIRTFPKGNSWTETTYLLCLRHTTQHQLGLVVHE